MVLPERRFRKLDRARLSRRVLRRTWPELIAALDGLRLAHAEYGESGSVVSLARRAQAFTGVLDGAFGLPPKHVFLRDRPRPHRRRNGRVVYELHGLCAADGPLEVYTRTAVQARPVALRALLNTLVHEWVHHYDFASFKASVHCSGFYERLAQVYRPSRDWLSEHDAPRGR